MQYKFRLWDVEKKVWRRDFAVHELGSIILWSDEYGMTTINPGLRFRVNQWTGLKDKNGKDVYEGDWVKSSSGQSWEVRWIERTAKFQFMSNNFGFDMNVIKDDEVVGNIYES